MIVIINLDGIVSKKEILNAGEIAKRRIMKVMHQMGYLKGKKELSII